MSSLNLRVLELFDDKRISFDETEQLLKAISFSRLTVGNLLKPKFKKQDLYIPPHASSYMNSNTMQKQI